MELKLYFVSGINRVDTPYFSSIEEQGKWFDTKKVATLEDFTFYPPHYQNNIRLTTDDIDFNSNINYLSLTYNDKVYYYFIDNITYISEDVIAIDITMDVIQTYMYNTRFINSDIERACIKRRTDGFYAVNRDYIRENVSDNDFILNSYNRLYNKDYYIIDISTTEPLKSMDGSTTTVDKSFRASILINDNRYVIDGMYHYFIFYSLTGKDLVFKNIPGFSYDDDSTGDYDINDTCSIDNISTLLDALSKLPQVVSMNVIPFDITKHFQYIITDREELTIEPGQYISPLLLYKLKVGNSGVSKSYVFGLSSEIAFKDFQLDITPDFHTYNLFSSEIPYYVQHNNGGKKVTYDVRYTPQLIDENFRKIMYGERISSTSLPLSQVTNFRYMAGRPTYICSNGNRAYTLYDNYLSSDLNDKYITTIVVPTQENFTLKNDAWTSYLSRNQASLTTGLGYQYFNDIVSPLKTLYGVGSHSVNDKKYGVGKVATGVVGSVVDAGLNVFDTYMQYNIRKDNLQKTPNTITQGNNVVDSIFLKSNEVIFQDYIVRDYEKVAEYFTKYGFKVKLHFDEENIFNALSYRRYFNYIKTSNVNLYLVDVLNDNTTIMQIEERLNNGIRLWDMANCDEDELEIGECLKYDNVEI